MSGQVAPRDDSAPWFVQIARAVLAIVFAAVITFSADHTALIGLVTFGIFAVASGLIVAFAASRASASAVRGVQFAQAGVSVVTGVVALAATGAGLPFLVFIVTAFAVITGFLELYLGVRGRGHDSSARDRIFVGALTVLLAVAVLIVPPGFEQPFNVSGVTGAVTATTFVVGLIGAYWAILGVYLAIAGLSLRWAGQPARSGDATVNGSGA